MRKIFLTILITLMVTSCSTNTNSIGDAKDAMTEKYPNIKINSIEQVNDSFFEITIQDQLYYLTSDFKHLIIGNVIDFKTGKNLTENRLKKERVKYLSEISDKDIVVYKPEKTEYTITIFTDTSCPYCQKLHNEVSELLSNNIEIHYVLFSRNGNDDDAYNDMVSIWCSDNQKKALDKAFANDFLETKTCTNPIADNYLIARDLKVNGTPMIYMEDGSVIPGYVSSDKIIDALAEVVSQ